jgi:hypothetical protein
MVDSFIKPQRGNSCILVIKSVKKRFERIMASNRDVCRKISQASKSFTYTQATSKGRIQLEL